MGQRTELLVSGSCAAPYIRHGTVRCSAVRQNQLHASPGAAHMMDRMSASGACVCVCVRARLLACCSKREPKDVEEAEGEEAVAAALGGRDVFNEKPSGEEILAAEGAAAAVALMLWRPLWLCCCCGHHGQGAFPI